MTAAQAATPGGGATPLSRMAWLPVAAVLVATGWGSNQFTPMLLVYSQALGVGAGTLEAMFGVYALGLIPGLLLAGPLSDARGRRTVVVPAAVISLAASLLLLTGANDVSVLFVGRFLAGVSSGAVFSAGTAWLREVCRPGLEGPSDRAGARRAVVALTTGFALGPLVAGMLAQWAPAPRTVPYLPHLALMAVVLVSLRNIPETIAPGAQRMGFSLPGIDSARFRGVVAPMAPWVFAAPAIAFALLPSVVGAQDATDGIALTAGITALCALAGVVIQPLARRLDNDPGANRSATAGLLVLVAGLMLGALTAHSGQSWLLVPSAIVLGSAYGLCLVAGLIEIQRLADPRALASLTAAYYALTYLGFAAPYLLTLGAHLTSYSTLLTIAAALALSTAGLVSRPSRLRSHVSALPEMRR